MEQKDKFLQENQKVIFSRKSLFDSKFELKLPLPTILSRIVLKKTTTLWIFFIVIFYQAFFLNGIIRAGNDPFTFGPRALGTGQIGLMNADVWSVQNNIGSLGWFNKSGVGVSFDNRYNLQALNQIAFSSAITTEKFGNFGIGASRFGADIFNQTRAQLGWAKRFGIASIGIQAQWYQIAAADFPSRNFLIVQFGGMAQLTPKIHFSGSIYNLNQAKGSEYQDEKIPTIVRAGLAFLPNPKVKLMTEVQKDLSQKAVFKAGLEYEFTEKVWARTGFVSQTNQVCGGIGVEWRNLVFDYAVSRHPNLGWTNSIGINYIFASKSTAETKSTN